MTRKLTSLLLVMVSFFKMNSQLLTDNFDATWSPVTLGWAVSLNSQPPGILGIFQGSGATTFPAFNGGPDDYIGMNFNNTAGAGGISTWLITPPLTIYNGAVFQFATRTTTSATWPDRLQLRMSPTNNATIPTGSASVGTFTTLLLDINPNLTTANSSVVVNGVVNGYPQAWALYSVLVTGVSGTVTGRFALRYFVANGGPTGTNSDYIGIDAVKYDLPCSVAVNNYTICSGGTATLSALGGISPLTYTWSPGNSNGSSLVVTPASTSTYALAYKEGTVTCPARTVTVTIGSNLSSGISASSNTVCDGTPVTLSVSAAATNYSWSNGATSAITTVTPGVTTTYSVGVLSGGCFGGNTITIYVNPVPSLTTVVSPVISCVPASVTITVSGATNYTTNGTTNPNPYIFTTNIDGEYGLVVAGSYNTGCASDAVVEWTVNPSPTVTAAASPTNPCINSLVSMSANGANSYAWSGAATSNNATFTYTTGTTAGTQTFNVVGTNTAGCTDDALVTIVVSLCTGIDAINKDGSELTIYPNPFSNELIISGSEGRLEIFNALGQRVYESQMSELQKVDASEFEKGVYVLKAYNSEGLETRTIKLIKN